MDMWTIKEPPEVKKFYEDNDRFYEIELNLIIRLRPHEEVGKEELLKTKFWANYLISLQPIMILVNEIPEKNEREE